MAIAAVAVAVLATAVAVSMTAPSAASAQGLPAICDEYPNLPICVEDQPGDGNQPTGDEGAGPTADRGVAKGELPFTGYPLTPLILLLLLLLLLGMAIRAYVEIRDRRRARTAGGAPLGIP